MLTFIIPLRSFQVSKSWEKVSKLLERTLQSVCGQTGGDFRAIVVCHEKPEIQFSHPGICYAEVDFAVPSGNLASKDRDQARKMWVGLNGLAEFAANNPGKNGWYIKQGYEYPDGSEIVYFRRKDFHRKTGTSHIIKYDLLQKFIDYELNEITNRNFLFHQYIVEIMSEMGHPLEPLSFPGSMYITENGENNLIHEKIFPPPKGMSLKETARYYAGMFYKPLISRPLTQAICNEFGLYKIHLNQELANLKGIEIATKMEG
jgi:hypothetical protein